jgi:asparagine synthase (glutamine-hydrolysing)
MLPPAHLLVYRPGAPPAIRRYWDVDFSPSAEAAEMTEGEIVDRSSSSCGVASMRRLMSDCAHRLLPERGHRLEPFHVLAAELSTGPLKTFTLTYAEGSTTAGKEQDRRWARWVAERYRTEHHEETIAFGDYPDSLRRIFAVLRRAFRGRGVHVLPRPAHQPPRQGGHSGRRRRRALRQLSLHRLALPLANYAEYARSGDASLIRPFEAQPDFLARLAPRAEWDWRHELMVFTDEEKSRLWAPDVAAAMRGFSTREHLRQLFAGLSATDPVNRILEAEFRTIFPDQVMTFVDRLSMAHSLEVRTAFLDTDVVEFVAGLPGPLKMRGGETKYLPQAGGAPVLPRGDGRPSQGRLRDAGDGLAPSRTGGLCRQTLSPARLSKHALFDSDRVQALVDELYRGQRDYRFVNKVLALVVFQEWHDMYMMGGE